MGGQIREIKSCPFCGCSAVIEKEPLWEGSHGYHGCYMVQVKCMNPLCGVSLPRHRYDTVYMDEETATRQAIDGWNRRMMNDG